MAEISKIIAGDVTYHLRDRNYCTCSTGAGTKAKTASLEGFVLTTGSVVNIRFDNSNTASDPTLNINDTGAYAIKRYGTTAASTAVASSWQAGSVVTLIFDGTYWMIGHGYDANTTYSAMSASEATTGTSTTGRLIGAKVLHDKINSMLPDSMTAEEATAGTSTTARTISAKILQDKIEEMKQTNAEMGQGYGISGNSIVTGSNELPYPFAETTKTVNGITFTDNGDGSITIDGTATDDTRFKFCENLTLIDGIEYIASFSDSSYDSLADLYDYNNSTTYYYLEKAESQSQIDISGSFYFEPNYPSGTIDELGIRIGVGDTFDNFVVYPKISSDDSTRWEPYTQSLTVTFPSYELVEGGIVAVKMNIDVPAGVGMNINSTGVLPIKYKGSAITSNIISSGDTVTFVYSNGNYHLISIDSGGSYTLPTASADTLGGIKVGENLSINNGVLSASGGTYESKAAVSGGTDVSLVTTGQKYTWNTKMNNYGTCSTAANVAAKTVSLSGFVLTTGSVVNVRFDNSNTASGPTLNINDTGAHAIMKYGSTAPGVTAASSWYAGSIITLIYDGTYWVMVDFNVTGMYIASYGSSTYAEVLEAYRDNKIIYCRASSNTNPATGDQLRMAFLAYVSNQTTPTTFEFQYYRSVRNHSSTQQGDQVYVYQLNQSSGWSVTVRQNYTKIVGGTGLNGSYSNGVLTLNHSNSVTAQTTQAIYPIKIDAQGHINSYGSAITPLTANSTLDATKLSGTVPRASLPSNYGTCSTAANVAAKTVNLSGFTLTTGAVIHVYFNYTNTASSPTLNVNSTGAKYIYRYANTTAGITEDSSWREGSVVTFVYSGSYWYIAGFEEENKEHGFGYNVSTFYYPTLNQLPYPYVDTTKTVNGITFTDNGDGTITVNGTATSDASFTLGNNFLSYNYDSGENDYFVGFDGDGKCIFEMKVKDEEPISFLYQDNLYLYPHEKIDYLYFIVPSGTTVTNYTIHPYILPHNTPFLTDYTPYGTPVLQPVIYNYKLSEGGIVALKVNDDILAGTLLDIYATGLKPIWHKGAAIKEGIISKGDTATFMYSDGKYHLLSVDKGQTNLSLGQGYGVSNNTIVSSKNIIPYPYTDTTKTVNGITFTDNGDGTITVNGTATGAASFTLYSGTFYPPEDDTNWFYFTKETGISASLADYPSQFYIETYNNMYNIDSNEYDIYIDGSSYDYISLIQFNVTLGAVFNNFILYPMIIQGYYSGNISWQPYGQVLKVNLSEYKPVQGGIVSVKVNVNVPAGSLIDINNNGALPIKYKGAAITANVLSSGDTATFMYSNECYYLISIDSGGSGSYTLPTASADTLGGVKVGTNLSISDGVLSATDTTYESKAAASGGTDVSLVTTGQKYKWNTKMNYYGTCSTSSGTTAKVVTLSSNSADFKLITGAIVHVKFTNTNSITSPTLNVNSTGAYYIKRYGTTSSMGTSSTSWLGGEVISFVFDGTYWMMMDPRNISLGAGLYFSGTSIYHDSSVSSQSTQAVYPITINSSGHITGYGSAQTILTASDVNDLIETYLSNNYGNGDEDTYGNGTSN